MNKKEAVREMLNSYLIWKNDIKNIELEIEEIKNNYDMSGIKLEDKTGPTYKINNITEDMIINKEPKIKSLEKEKRCNEINCEKVENAVNVLKEFEKEVVVLKYMTSPIQSWFTVSRKLGFSRIACQKAEDRAIDKMIPLLIKDI